MVSTYVFDFYNLYIPKGKKYENQKLGIKITPLKFAEEFEKNRKKFSKPYYRGGWKTAKCFIKTKTKDEAIKLANWISFLYSFAQNRSVFYLGGYKYKGGKKYSSFQSKFIEPRENRFSELIHATHTKGALYSRDISLFLDISLEVLSSAKDSKLNEILIALHSLSISKSEIIIELKFLICWSALEKLANQYYLSNKPKKELFSKDESEKLKSDLEKALENNFEKDDNRLDFLKDNFKKSFLYENNPNTLTKINTYFDSLDLGFEKNKLEVMLKKLMRIRGSLIHNLSSNKLKKEPRLLFYLQMILENVLFRNLGVDKNMQSKFILHQYNRGDDL